MRSATRGFVLALVALATATGPALGDDTAPATGSAAEAAEPDADAAVDVPWSEDPSLPHLAGPRTMTLPGDLEVTVPAGMVLYEQTAARAILRRGGDTDSSVVAIIEPVDGAWWIAIDWSDVGYVTDTDADHLDAEELLASYRQGTIQMNAERTRLGIPELFIDGWSTPPAYDQPTHQLRFGITAHDSDGLSVNDMTRILGRRGYAEYVVVTDPATLAADKIAAQPILASLHFRPGATYAEYVAGTDKHSGMGLRGLVLGGVGIGVAAKAVKIGLIAKFAIVFKKLWFLFVGGIVGLWKLISGRRRHEEPESAANSVPPGTAPPP